MIKAFIDYDSDSQLISGIWCYNALSIPSQETGTIYEISLANYELLKLSLPDYHMVSTASHAVGTITMSGIAVENEPFTIDTQTFTWKPLRSVAGEVTIGADAPEAVINIVAAVTADLATVTASDGAGDTVAITSVPHGVLGNSIDFSESSTNMTMNGSGHLGGTVAGVDEVFAEKPLLTTVATWDKTTLDADGVDAATLGTGLPNPTSIYISITTAEGAELITPFDATTGSLVIKSNVVGVYQVTAMAEGYKPYVTAITAVVP